MTAPHSLECHACRGTGETFPRRPCTLDFARDLIVPTAETFGWNPPVYGVPIDQHADTDFFIAYGHQPWHRILAAAMKTARDVGVRYRPRSGVSISVHHRWARFYADCQAGQLHTAYDPDDSQPGSVPVTTVDLKGLAQE